MIEYEMGRWQLALLFSCRGSVIPRALVFALPASCFAIALHILNTEMTLGLENWLNGAATGQIWAGYNFVLSFLLVFRTQNAYSRFWEGGTLLSRTSGQWRTAISSCFAFCSPDPAKEKEVKKFQRRLCQLASLLHCMSLQQIAYMEDENFQILDVRDVDIAKLQFLGHTRHERCGVVMQWMQKLIANATQTDVLSAPAPIVSRCFQELSLGLVSFNEALKIREIFFPFPYLQIVQVMLCITTLVAPFINTVVLNNLLTSSTITLVSIAAFWSINYIAAEIEMPYGDDPNDLPIAEIQISFNDYLLMLAEREMDQPPMNVPDEHLFTPLAKMEFSDIFQVPDNQDIMKFASGRLTLSHWHNHKGSTFDLVDSVRRDQQAAEMRRNAQHEALDESTDTDVPSLRPPLLRTRSRDSGGQVRVEKSIEVHISQGGAFREAGQHDKVPFEEEEDALKESLEGVTTQADRSATREALIPSDRSATREALIPSDSFRCTDERGLLHALDNSKTTDIEKQLIQLSLRIEQHLASISKDLARDSDGMPLKTSQPSSSMCSSRFLGCGPR